MTRPDSSKVSHRENYQFSKLKSYRGHQINNIILCGTAIYQFIAMQKNKIDVVNKNFALVSKIVDLFSDDNRDIPQNKSCGIAKKTLRIHYYYYYYWLLLLLLLLFLLLGRLHFTGHYYSSDFIVTFSWGLLPPNPCNISSGLYVPIVHSS